MIVKKGQILALTEGEYSDYNLRDHVRALKNFDTSAAIKEFKERGDYLKPPSYDPGGEPTRYGSDDRFIAWAIREGFIEPLNESEVQEWYLGAYGELEDE